MPPIITLLTDFGTADSYVGEVKGTLLSRVHGAAVVREVVYVDRFGALLANLAEEKAEPGVRIKVAGREIGPLARTFGDVPRGQLVALVGSGGTVEIAVRDGSAARLLGVGVGAEVRA